MSVLGKKRPHSVSIAATSEKLGAGEFATILNGDDARQILSALKSFTTTVKRERKEALEITDEDGSDDDDDDDDDDSDGSDDDAETEGNEKSDSTSNKKLKEDWMKDSKDYNVPFVGTSVAKGDTGHVVVGEWPTGFLEAYLKQSPLAVELTSTDLVPPFGHVHKKLLRQKQGKLSYAIYRAYLAALSELVTAAIPIAALKREHGINDEEDEIAVVKDQPKFMTTLIKDRFPTLMQLLNDETGGGKGKTGSISGIGQLSSVVLHIISRLAATSLGTSRHVARALDASLRDGVLKILLREPRKPKEKPGEAGIVVTKEEQEKQRDRLAVPYKTRSACLRLATVLLDAHDASVTSYIATFGNKDRKNNAGILYMAVRYGLQDSMFQEQDQETISEAQEEYLESVSDLLQSLSVLVEEEKEGASLTRRAMADLLGAEALQNISQTATCAPALRSFESVLTSEDDDYDEVTPTEDVGVDARRLLFPLLSNSSKSPFLWRITGKDDDKLSTLYTTFIVKALNQLLNTSASVPTQNFIIHALTGNTLLLPGFFKGLHIPDVNKSTLRFLATLRFIGRTMKEGPPPSLCIAEATTVDLTPRGVDKILLSLLPQNLNKHVLSRAIQSKNPLAVAEATKFAILALKRFQSLLPTFLDENVRTMVSRAFFTRLPDVQALVSTRSKFDPFVNHGKKENVIINGLLCRLLDTFVEVVPNVIVSSKFDWTKLLPDDPANFTKAKPIAQVQILQTLDNIMKCKASQGTTAAAVSKPTAKACRALIEVAINASHVEAYSRARSIAKEMLLQLIECPTDASEASYCMKYEISLWIDGLEQELLPQFQSLLDETVKNTFRHKLSRIQSWKKAGLQGAVPDFSFSLILSIALSKLDGEMSDKFARLIGQIASRCLLFHSNPVPLAAVVQEAFSENPTAQGEINLQVYSSCMLDICKTEFNSKRSLEVFQHGTKLLESLIGNFLKAEDRDDVFTHLNTDVTTRERTLYLRYCLQTIAVIDGFAEHAEQKQVFVEKIHHTIRRLLQCGETEPILKIMSHPALSLGFLPRGTIGFLQLLALVCSAPGAQNGVDFTGITASLVSLLADCTDIGKLPIFDILRLWLSNHYVEVPQYNAIGNDLVRLATNSSSTKRTRAIRNVERALALNWTNQQNISFSADTAWEAWTSETSTLAEPGQCNFAIVRAMESALCSVEKVDECSLFVKIKELGSHETLGRCLRSLRLGKDTGVTRDCKSSLLAKAIEIGCEDIEQVLLFLTAGMDSDVNAAKSFLKYYDVSPSEFNGLWSSGIFNSALIASMKYRDDDLVRTSLANTIKESQSQELASQLLITLSSGRDMDARRIAAGEDSPFLKYLIEFAGSPHQPDEYHLSVLAILFDSLPKALKNAFREGEDDAASISFCRLLLDHAHVVLGNLSGNGLDFSHIDIDSVVKACLKLGISGSQGKLASQKASCLRLVRLLLCVRHQQESPPNSAESSTFLNPSIIWTMALSHSSFTDAIIPPEGLDGKEWRLAREELIKLLVCCSSLSNESLSIEESSLNALLIAFNAGTTPNDTALRRLFHLVAGSMTEAEMPFAEKMCNRAFSSLSGNESKEAGWRFLGEVLDPRRVRETISQFPRFKYLSPKPLDFEKWIRAEDANDTPILEEADDKVMEKADSDTDSSDDDSSVENTSDEKLIRAQLPTPVVDDIWKGRGPDNRYDPSFVVPQIVAALESLYVEEIDDEVTEYSEAFARFAQQIVEKGGLCLFLASLCSYCPSVRKHAFAGLCLLLQAVDLEAAKDSKTWRERPQLKMILNSVQRGFVLRKTMLVSKGMFTLIPRVSPLSAIFLAKASLILSKPGDVMFSAMNRYFLKLDNAHGAYDDMTRLPAFISLFCSSVEEDSARERHWVLQCLRDSFLEGYSIVASCHAPQLLLTTLGRTSLDDVERQLIIQVLTRLLQFGERAAAHDLLGRVGLLSWLRGFLVSRPMEDTSPSLALVEVAVQQAMQYTETQSREQLILDLRNLLVTTAMMNGGAQVFCLVVDSLSQLGYQKSVSAAGVPLDTGLELLRSAAAAKKTKMLEAICTAPVVIDGGSVPDYCTTVLRNLLELPDADISLVLQRICDLIKNDDSDDWSNDILKLVLTTHARAVRTDAYRFCLEALIAKASKEDDNECISLAKKALNILQEDAKHPKK